MTDASATGTLTVDTIGTGLTAANFTAWDVTVTVTTNSVNFTDSNGSVLELVGTTPPTVVSTANSLTITPDGGGSYFDIKIGDFSGQFYYLDFSAEVFRYGATTGTEQIVNNSPPASLVLPCVASSPPVSASIGLMSSEKPVIFSEEIEVK